MKRATYRDADQVVRADTCKPLREAVADGRVELQALARPPYPGGQLAPSELAGVVSVGRWNAPHDQDWGLPWHFNEGIELTYVSHGAVTCSVETGRGICTTTLRAGDVSLTRPWQRHRLGDPHLEACRVHWLILDVGVRRPHQRWRWPAWSLLGPSLRHTLRSVVQRSDRPFFRADPSLGHAITALTDLATVAAGPARAAHLAVAANQVCVQLVATLERAHPPLEDALTATRSAVEAFLRGLEARAQEPWTLDTMATACGLGRTQFARHCRAITNMSPWQYLRECRLKLARQLLRHRPTMSVTDVAFACGFGSSQRFAVVFKDRHGLSASAFRHAPREG
ncbi:MAG: helix-turn-helix transcriptional regulator [Trueperaceae bacterium]|nr:helix-turn-helix transcriptional regulator [Trueperaceae bacterium]